MAGKEIEEYPQEISMSLMGHLRELHKRVLRSVCILLAFMLVGFLISEPLFRMIMSALPEGVAQKNFTLFGPFLMRMKLALYFGLFMSLPFLSYQAYAFVKPALRVKENRFAVFFLGGAWVLLVIAFAFTYTALGFFVDSLLSWTPEGVVNEADVNTFISDFLAIYIGFALLFQIPLVIFLTVAQGFVEASFYRENRRWVIVILLTLCAIFTPPDVTSQIVVFIPIYALFELATWLGAWFRRG